MSDLDHAAILLEAARRDLTAADAMRTDPAVFADEIFGFQVQQCAEKSLKAWIALLQRPFPFTHDLETLLEVLRAAGEHVDAFAALTALSLFAVALRYGSLRSHNVRLLDRTETVDDVRRLFESVEQRLERTRGRSDP